MSVSKCIYFIKNTAVMRKPVKALIDPDWLTTRLNIVNNKPIIYTTQMALLTTLLFKKGYRVFVQINSTNGFVEVKLGENEWTSKEIKPGTNLYRLWLSGEMNNAEPTDVIL